MSEISKQALKVENSQSFPNNSAGLITPSDLRAFNEDMIDSLVDEITYNADSASWNQSIDALEQFTSSQQPSFTALNEFTASQLVINSGVNGFTQSADGRLDALESEVDSLQTWTGSVNEISDDGIVQGYSTRLHFYGNVSASIVQNVGGAIASINIPLSDIDTGSLLLTASFDDTTRNLTFTKGDSSTFAVNIPDVSGSVLPAGVVSGSSQIILQDTTGDLSGSRIDGAVALATNSTYADNTIVYGKNLHSTTIAKGTPLFFTGSGTGGNLVGILPADAGNPLLMPAGGVAGETIAVGEEGIILLDGFINEVDTTLFAAGDEIYVGVGGGYTNVPPTGSANLIQKLGNVEKSAVNGSGVIQMDGEARGLPNLQSGYAWVGDGNDVPQAVATSSFAGDSFPYIGDAQITGSLSVSKTIESQIYINPQTLSGSLTIPTEKNAMVIGTVSVDGTVVIEGNSKLVVIDQIEPYVLPEGILSSSVTDFTTYSASVDTRINNITFDSSSLATTGSNLFIGDQIISGNIELDFNGTDRTGIKYNSGSFQIFAGLNDEGRYIISSSGNSKSIEINPQNGWLEVYGTTNYNAAINARDVLQVRNIITPEIEPDFNHLAQFNNLSASGSFEVSGSVSLLNKMNLKPQDPLPTGNIGDLAVSGSSIYFYNGAWTLIV